MAHCSRAARAAPDGGEGEPGTFKDRVYLERDLHRFLEGVLIAARVVGVEACYIYLRDEYHAAARRCKPSWSNCRPIRLARFR